MIYYWCDHCKRAFDSPSVCLKSHKSTREIVVRDPKYLDDLGTTLEDGNDGRHGRAGERKGKP
jgi:hypothetical protein